MINIFKPIATGWGLIIWVVICYCPALIGIAFPPGDWYASLQKPSWTPPTWLFGPVWTMLYATMAIAAWLVWKRGGFKAQRKPLALFFVQLALNAAWTPIFFGLHKPGLAFITIVLLWLAIMATIAAFQRASQIAASLLIPYLLWVAFAATLNFSFWRLNT